MQTARILLKQGDLLYRFMRFESSSDGSIIAIVDRDPRSKRGGAELGRDGNFEPLNDASDKALPSTRFSIHTTGIVHRHHAGKRVSTHRIQPIYALTKVSLIGFVSIPRIQRLDPFDATKDQHTVAACLEFPDPSEDRISFGLEIGPKPQTPATFGAALNYEVYSIMVRLVPPPVCVPPHMSDHFIYGGIQVDGKVEPLVDKARAELNFYQQVHGAHIPPFRDAEGAYIFLAAVRMAKAPELIVSFDRPDLSIEAIPFPGGLQPTHKVRFWICDKGGRNKTADLRKHITSIELRAEL